jgi:Fe-S oxidoreductase
VLRGCVPKKLLMYAAQYGDAIAEAAGYGWQLPEDPSAFHMATWQAAKTADNAFLFEEFLAREKKAGRLSLELKPLPQKAALLHGHCHQKAFGAMSAVQEILSLVPDLAVSAIESSCCGMAGSFGYEAEHFDISIAMAELSLLPAVRKASADALVVADGTSCRHQIADGANRQAIHVAQVLERALA